MASTIRRKPVLSSENAESGDVSSLDRVMCFSTMHAPSATAPTATVSPSVWSDRPTGTPQRASMAGMARRLTASGGDG